GRRWLAVEVRSPHLRAVRALDARCRAPVPPEGSLPLRVAAVGVRSGHSRHRRIDVRSPRPRRAGDRDPRGGAPRHARRTARVADCAEDAARRLGPLRTPPQTNVEYGYVSTDMIG